MKLKIPSTISTPFLLLMLFFLQSLTTMVESFPRPRAPPLPGHASSIDVFLTEHNKARAAVGGGVPLPPLVWNSTLADYAASYAAKLATAYNCQLKHSGGPYGENLAMSSGAELKAADAVKMWVAEKVYYRYASNKCDYNQVCGHYTQVVWRNSKRLGCGTASCYQNGGTIVSCNYDPPGNYVRQRPY